MNLIDLTFKIYKKCISPFFGNRCRFDPPCSNYAHTAFKKYNFFKASYLSCKRLIRCNPLSKGFFDPVP